uniref:1-methyl alkyl succinate synthase subunit Mas E n=1 Tax=Azoarcus sp. HxN1 TaxID=83404 RepID=A9J4K6_9RHOO|nr:1-methyl alkyl succinate synthase subunit Mas E [Azoarcus sp. HxN1]
MKCTECGHEAEVMKFRYHYNPRIDASLSLRQCPECQAVVTVDELKREVLGRMHNGDDPWGKSAGIENLAEG